MERIVKGNRLCLSVIPRPWQQFFSAEELEELHEPEYREELERLIKGKTWIRKLKITISGPKVHDIGHRVFLLKKAMNTALPRLSIYHWEEGERILRSFRIVQDDHPNMFLSP